MGDPSGTKRYDSSTNNETVTQTGKNAVKL